MKTTSCSFFLLSSILLFLVACTDTQNLVTTECDPEPEAPNYYTEYEGTMSLARDLVGIYLEHSDQPERDEFIDIRWSLGEHIYVVSEKFEFDDGDCLIWGSMGCEIWDAEPKEETVDDKGVTWLYFEPVDDFWRCLELDGCDPGTEVFDFHLMAREKGE